MLSWFRTYDHLNYSGWAPVYYSDMLSLEQRAPEVYQWEAIFQSGLH